MRYELPEWLLPDQQFFENVEPPNVHVTMTMLQIRLPGNFTLALPTALAVDNLDELLWDHLWSWTVQYDEISLEDAAAGEG